MKAWRVEAHGGLEALKRVEVPTPAPGPMEATVRVEAVGLNHLDLWVRNGVEGHRFPLPLTLGCDIAGTVETLGPGAEAALAVDAIRAGSPVLVNPITSCGRCQACLTGFEPLCPKFGILGETQDGGCSDFIRVPVANVIARPPQISAVDAAALPIPFITAWSMLTRKAQLKPGELILIHAAGSGVSIAAIQIAKLLGASVIATVGDDWKAEKAQGLGADYVVDYSRKKDFRAEVRKLLPLYGKKGCDVVLDHVGQATFSESMKCLAWGGRLVCCGATSGGDVTVDLKALFFKNLSILGSTMGGRADLIQVLKLVAGGKLQPVIDSTFSMSELPKAQAKLESRQVFGKVVVTAD